jgi:hypothetical protein
VSSGGGVGLGLSVGPGGVFVVVGSGFEGSAELADEAVPERSEGLMVKVTCGASLIIEVTAPGTGLEGTERPLIDGVVESPVADMSGEHRSRFSGSFR